MKNIIGKQGEALAVKFLKQNKYKILQTNFSTHVGEIDIIAIKNNVVTFVEVKYRSSLKFGSPREAVNTHKQNKIRLVASQFLQTNNLSGAQVQFDVVEILDGEITHIPNAF